MVFAFSEVCTLFTRLEDIELHQPPILVAAERNARSRAITESWFKSHRSAIDKLLPAEALALLSALLPERRCDRVYGIQSASLCRILSLCLGLSAAHAKDLQAYKKPGGGDLGVCLARVLRAGGPPARPPVHVEEVDDLLTTLGSACRFSAPDLTMCPSSTEQRHAQTGNIVKRLDPTQAKWLVRLVLKDLSPVRLHEITVLQSFHFLLPDLLRFQNTFEAALKLLNGPLRDFPSRPDPRSERLHRESAALLLKPVIGVKVGRPRFIKCRSIDSCIRLCEDQKWILERKYDGEYCEIHVDLHQSSNLSECLKLFSKSGKDSTYDRKNIHQTLIDCLHLDRLDRKIKERAIILGEIVVYSGKSAEILPFEHLRQHVTRSGVFLGTNEDSYPDRSEHLAIVFFDLLLLDDEIIMKKPLHERRQRLREVYTKLQGRAMSAEWKIVDFRDVKNAKRTLVQQFAASIAQRCEGLILKPYGEPYFSLNCDGSDSTKSYIKLKKDYIAGLGDEADFAVVGASYDGQQALQCGIQHVKWTSFHLGCLLNKLDVLRFDALPRFKIVATLHAQHCIPRAVLAAINVLGAFSAKPCTRELSSEEFRIECVPRDMDTTFENPLVLEVLGSGFGKPSNSPFLMLRHPRAKRVHQDRTWRDCISLEELQQQAIAARDAPSIGESQETLGLIEKMAAKCYKRDNRRRRSTPGTKMATVPSGDGRSHQCLSSQGEQRENLGLKQVSFNASLDVASPVNRILQRPKRLRESLNDARKESSLNKRRICNSIDGLKECDNRTAPTDAAFNPLVDITNTALEHRLDPLCRTWESSSRFGECNNNHKGSFVRPKPPHTFSRPPSSPPPASQRSGICATNSCFFAGTVIYASSCITSSPYIMRDLLPCHNITMAASLTYWDRDSFAHSLGIDIVSESQAYEGMRKIVLVDRMQLHAVRETVKRVLLLNMGRWREKVEVWDWRVLESEDCRLHNTITTGKTTGYFLGATEFEMEEDRTVFLAAQGFGVGSEFSV